MRRTRTSAFTLVELLVVIGIIALLIAILLPSLRKARQAGIAATCLSNLRQVGMAFHIYANENKGWLPSPGPNQDFRLAPGALALTFPERLVLANCVKMNLPRGWSWYDTGGSRYFPISQQQKGIFVCPGWDGTGSDEGGSTRAQSRGYGMTRYILPEKKDVTNTHYLAPFVKLQRLPKGAVVLFDGYRVLGGAMNDHWVATNTGAFTNWQGNLVNTTGSYKQYGLYMRHNKAPNYLFSDWSASRDDSLHKTGYKTANNRWYIDPKVFTFVREITASD